MGQFHLKMACADAIWRIFINPAKARQDETALIKLIGQLRPRETGRITSNPGFCCMHDVISSGGWAGLGSKAWAWAGLSWAWACMVSGIIGKK
jgi:hypothetical protein